VVPSECAMLFILLRNYGVNGSSGRVRAERLRIVAGLKRQIEFSPSRGEWRRVCARKLRVDGQHLVIEECEPAESRNDAPVISANRDGGSQGEHSVCAGIKAQSSVIEILLPIEFNPARELDEQKRPLAEPAQESDLFEVACRRLENPTPLSGSTNTNLQFRNHPSFPWSTLRVKDDQVPET
jgi:hypothetical protein